MLTYKLNENKNFKKAALQIKYSKYTPKFIRYSFVWQNYIMKNNLHFGRNTYVNCTLCNAFAETNKAFKKYKRNVERLLQQDKGS